MARLWDQVVGILRVQRVNYGFIVKLRKFCFLMGLATILATAQAVVLPAEAHSCTCLPTPSAAEAMDNADAVFWGEVTQFERGEWQHRVYLKPERSWKGADDEVVEVVTASSAAACGFNFEIGQSYLVYALATDDDLEVTLCGRTHRADRDEAQAEVAGAGVDWTVVVDPLTTVLGYVHVQLERRISDRFTLYMGPHLRLFDSVFSDEKEPYRGYGAELGVRFFPLGGAIDGFWVGIRGVAARVVTHDPAEPASEFGGYVSALAGYTHFLGSRFVLSGGAGMQYIHYEVADFGVSGPLPALHTAAGLRF